MSSAPSAVPAAAAAPDAVPALHLNLSSTFGVIFWAFVVSTTLFGVSVVQGYFYYMHNGDRRNLKAFVAMMILLDFTTTALSSEALYDYLIVNFGNPLALLYMTKPYIAEYVITAVVTLCSQLFYASRIHIADKRARHFGVPYIIAFLALAAFGLAIACTQEIFHNGRLISGLKEQKMLTLAGLNTGVAAACDILATVAMCVFLTSQKSQYKQTKRIVTFLLFFTINRGVLVALAQIGFLTSYVAAPSKIYWMPFHLSISKLHVNTLLGMLNSRTSLRARVATELTQVRFSKDCTFNSLYGAPGSGVSTGMGLEIDLPRVPPVPHRLSIKNRGSLRLEKPTGGVGVAYELGDLSKAEKSPTSATTMDSPSSKLTAGDSDDSDDVYYAQAHTVPTFPSDRDREETDRESVVSGRV